MRYSTPLLRLKSILVLFQILKQVACCRLRLSSQNLYIETGRYGNKPNPKDEKICRYCDSISNYALEDEFHFVMVYPPSSLWTKTAKKFARMRRRTLVGASARALHIKLKMADEGDSLSNAELREQLMHYGVKHGPITTTTKALLLKKLNEAKSGDRGSSPKVDKAKKRRSVATSTPSKQRTKLAGFSSDEDEIAIKKSASVDSPSAAARRRSAFPRVTYINDSNDSNNSEEKVTATTAISRRRSLPRTPLRGTKSLDLIQRQTKSLVNDSSATANDEDVDEIETTRPNYRKNSFDLEEEHDIVQKRKTKTDQRQSPASSSSSNSTIGNVSMATRSQGKPKGQNQAARDQTDSIAEVFLHY